MGINIVIVVLLQFILACAPMAGQATALDHDNDPEQLGNINSELFQEFLKQRDLVRVKNHRVVLPRERAMINARLQQDDLLQELLTPEVSGPVAFGHGSIPKDSEAATSHSNSRENSRQENLLLKEFTVETSNP